jgi:tetratricopeptide (TPR) repeat protein
MNPMRMFRALVVRAFLLGVMFLIVASTPPPPNPSLLTVNLAAHRPMQALYQIEAQVSQSGWTADLAKSAADIWEALDDLPQATTYWEIALSLQPTDERLIRRVAQSYLELQRWSQAVIALSNLLEITDDNWAHFQLGILQSVLDGEIAAEQLTLSVRDNQFQSVVQQLTPLMNEPSDIARAMKVGTVLATAKLWSNAEYVFQYAASFSPPFPEALAYAGLARDQQGKNGRPQIDRAVALAPNNAQVRYLQGLHFHLVGDEANSLVALQQATVLDPLNPAYAAELAATYDRAGDSPKAEYWYKAAVTLSNNDPRFQALLTAFYGQPSVAIITATP